MILKTIQLNKNTFNNFQDRAFLQSFDALELREIVERCPIELEREAGPVTRLFLVNKNLIDLLHKFHRTHLENITT